ncbi:permease for cytosine/purines, uracil, thiamine, allantoin-domain-containing protein [Lipomyces starkeyi]
MSADKSLSSIEKAAAAPTLTDSDSSNIHEDKDAGVIQDARLAARFQIEVRGIERVPEEEQTDNSIWNAASMWFAANIVVSTFSLGTLGIGIFRNVVLGLSPHYHLLQHHWHDSRRVLFNLRSALRTSADDPFSLLVRSHGAKIFAILNCIACVGWSAVNTVVAAQLLHTVNNGSLPPWGAVHIDEKWAWIPTFIIFLVVNARFKISGNFTFGTLESGRIEAGNVLSFGAAVFGFPTGWASYASDYVVYQPKQTSRIKIFLAIISGLACMTGTLTSAAYADNYNANGIGGLFYAILVPDSLHGFGQFCLVLMALSTIANNCPNMYSVALSVQIIDRNLAKIPRLIWTVITTGVFLAISIPAYYSFATFMDNFMNIIGYWLAIYEGISLPEHFLFKRGFSGYNVGDYDNPSKLHVGLSACFAFCCGVTGAVLGMYQVWWTGPIALIPGDVGFELSFSFAIVTYLVARPFELRYFGR